jgi:hypothetical protein
MLTITTTMVAMMTTMLNLSRQSPIKTAMRLNRLNSSLTSLDVQSMVRLNQRH